MAFVPERMDENKIQFLANEMTKTYMGNKTSLNSDEFMQEYYNFYNNAKLYIAREEGKRKAAIDNLSFDDVMSSDLNDEHSNGKHFSF